MVAFLVDARLARTHRDANAKRAQGNTPRNIAPLPRLSFAGTPLTSGAPAALVPLNWGDSKMTDSFGQMVTRARRAAKERGAAWVVATIDHEEGRKLTVCSERYSHSDEFEAFAGEVLAVVAPDGSVEVA